MKAKQLVEQAIQKADAIYAKGETFGYEQSIKVGDYRNSVAVNLSPDSQVALLLEDAAKAICQFDCPTFGEACEILEAYVALKKIGFMCRI